MRFILIILIYSLCMLLSFNGVFGAFERPKHIGEQRKMLLQQLDDKYRYVFFNLMN